MADCDGWTVWPALRVRTEPGRERIVMTVMRDLWSPCEEPERPYDQDTGFHIGCVGCKISLDAHLRREPDDERRRRLRLLID